MGAATTAVLYFLRLQGPLRGLMIEIDTLQAAAASLARIIGVTDLGSGPDVPDTPDVTKKQEEADSRPGGRVRVASVRFAYEGAADVLHDVSLNIPAGQRVAVVGTSGAGKTTLAALIAGIHRPSTGTVDAPTDTMLVSQETHIFSGTLRDNLTLAAPDVTDEDLVTALTRVGATDLLDELPLGQDSPVGAQGHPLTTSQEQHLVLTRLLIADPDLAILDEATAEAGSAHAAVLDHAAEVVLQGRTGVVIAHRLSQAAACDRIVLMEQGRVIEDGTHAELVAADGPYSRLWSAWNANRTPRT